MLRPLQAVQGVVERRQTLPILTNVLLAAEGGELEVTATDMEMELVSRTALDDFEPGEITVPVRKLVDICRSLPADARVDLRIDGERVLVRSGAASGAAWRCSTALGAARRASTIGERASAGRSP